jgi:hypothetical protein
MFVMRVSSEERELIARLVQQEQRPASDAIRSLIRKAVNSEPQAVDRVDELLPLIGRMHVELAETRERAERAEAREDEEANEEAASDMDPLDLRDVFGPYSDVSEHGT